MTDFISVPTLKQLSIKRILILLWNSEEIRTVINNMINVVPRKKKWFQMVFHNDVKQWERIEMIVRENIRKLPLPKKMENEFAHFFRLIGLELLAWIEFHFTYVKITPKIPGKLCWRASNGTIDRPATAEILVNEQTIDVF